VSFELFKTLFQDVKRRFLSSNRFGLDSYLSVRVRHGTIEGHFRREFERAGLVTRRASPGGAYLDNNKWDEYLFETGFSESIRGRVQSCLRKLSAELDCLISDLTGRYLRVTEEDEHPEGWFAITFSDVDLLYLHGLVPDANDVDTFLDQLFVALWDRTNIVLAQVREKIRGEFGDELYALLDQTKEAVEHVLDRGALKLFESNVTKCSTEVRNSLESCAHWFRRVDRWAMNDYTLATLVEAAITNVKRCYPSTSFDAIVEGDVSRLLKGHTFSWFWDIIVILLDNVVKHAGDPSQAKVVIIDDSETLSLAVSNPLPEGCDISAFGERMRELCNAAGGSTAGASVRNEGGTGIFKLNKLVNHDLRRSTSHVVFEIVEPSSFSAVVRMELKGLCP